MTTSSHCVCHGWQGRARVTQIVQQRPLRPAFRQWAHGKEVLVFCVCRKGDQATEFLFGIRGTPCRAPPQTSAGIAEVTSSYNLRCFTFFLPTFPSQSRLDDDVLGGAWVGEPWGVSLADAVLIIPEAVPYLHMASVTRVREADAPWIIVCVGCLPVRQTPPGVVIKRSRLWVSRTLLKMTRGWLVRVIVVLC